MTTNSTPVTHDYKGRVIRKKTHLRYGASSPELAVCSDLRGPVVDPTYLTSNEDEVTCKRCRSIRCLPPVAP